MNLYELSEMVEKANEACGLAKIDPKQITVVSVDYNTSMPVKHTELDPHMLIFKLNVDH
jgi:hypothetical protein